MKRQRNFPLTYFIRIKLISCGGKKKRKGQLRRRQALAGIRINIKWKVLKFITNWIDLCSAQRWKSKVTKWKLFLGPPVEQIKSEWREFLCSHRVNQIKRFILGSFFMRAHKFGLVLRSESYASSRRITYSPRHTYKAHPHSDIHAFQEQSKVNNSSCKNNQVETVKCCACCSCTQLK